MAELVTKASVNEIPTESKNIVLTKKLNNTLYSLAVRTTTDMVYRDKTYKYTLTEILSDVSDALVAHSESIADVSEKFAELMKDCPEEFNTLKEIADYISVNGDPKSALIQLIESKQNSEEGKGLSTNDFTDILYTKLVNDYSKEELDQKFMIVAENINSITGRVELLERANNFYMSVNDDTLNGSVKDYDFWFKIISKDA